MSNLDDKINNIQKDINKFNKNLINDENQINQYLENKEYHKINSEIYQVTKPKDALWGLFTSEESKKYCEELCNKYYDVEGGLRKVAAFRDPDLVERYARLLDTPELNDRVKIHAPIGNVCDCATVETMRNLAAVLEKYDISKEICKIAETTNSAFAIKSILALFDSDKEGIVEMAKFISSFDKNGIIRYGALLSQIDVLGPYALDKRKEVLESIRMVDGGGETAKLAKACQLYSEPEIVRLFDREGAKPAVSEIIELYQKMDDKYAALKVARVCREYREITIPAYVANQVSKINKDKLDTVVRCLQKYSSVPAVLQALYGNLDKVEQIDFKEVFSDQAYSAITKSRNKKTVESIFFGNYTQFKKEVDLACSYRDLELVKETYNLVAEIHSKRTANNLDKILKNFYVELNRSINQSDKYFYQVRNLRRYCHEVQEQMRDHSDELMVVGNA